MAVVLHTEERRKEVTFLSDVDVKFISFVRHGANQMPFRVIKSDYSGDRPKEKMGGNMLIVQSLILPEGVTLEELAKEEGMEWVLEANISKETLADGYLTYTQCSMEKMDVDSVQMVRLPKGWAMVGKAKEDASGDFITLGEQTAHKIGIATSAPMDAFFNEETASAVGVAFSELFARELYSMVDIVYGAMNQVTTEPSKRKKMVVTAIDSFKAFVSMGLDALQEKSADIKEYKLIDPEKEKAKMGISFESHEEFAKAVKDILIQFAQEQNESGPESPEAEAGGAEASQPESNSGGQEKTKEANEHVFTEDSKKGEEINQAVKDEITKLAEAVEKISEKVESLSAKPANAPAGASFQDNEEQVDGNQEEGESVFSGLVMKRR